jgi:hypothetical protein
MAEIAMSKPLRRSAAKTAKPIDIDKVGKLMRMLNSDKEGEVLASVGALRRVLRAVHLDLHDLAEAAVAGFKPRNPAASSGSPATPDLHNWESMGWWRHNHIGYLSDDDREYVADALLGRVGFELGRATPELMRRLRGIVARVEAARNAEDVW